MNIAEKYYKKTLAYDDNLDFSNQSPLTHRGVINLLESFAKSTQTKTLNEAQIEEVSKWMTKEMGLYIITPREFIEEFTYRLEAERKEAEKVKKSQILEPPPVIKNTSASRIFEGSIKPPIGLTPRKFHNEMRIKDIIEAMGRYANEGKQIPIEWINELNELNQLNKEI